VYFHVGVPPGNLPASSAVTSSSCDVIITDENSSLEKNFGFLLSSHKDHLFLALVCVEVTGSSTSSRLASWPTVVLEVLQFVVKTKKR
jgi:hypothetical protein